MLVKGAPGDIGRVCKHITCTIASLVVGITKHTVVKLRSSEITGIRKRWLVWWFHQMMYTINECHNVAHLFRVGSCTSRACNVWPIYNCGEGTSQWFVFFVFDGFSNWYSNVVLPQFLIRRIYMLFIICVYQYHRINIFSQNNNYVLNQGNYNDIIWKPFNCFVTCNQYLIICSRKHACLNYLNTQQSE